MDGLKAPYRIKLYVLPNGFVKPSLETEGAGPTPLEGLAFYYQVEPEIIRFKEAVARRLSASAQSGMNQKENTNK